MDKNEEKMVWMAAYLVALHSRELSSVAATVAAEAVENYKNYLLVSAQRGD